MCVCVCVNVGICVVNESEFVADAAAVAPGLRYEHDHADVHVCEGRCDAIFMIVPFCCCEVEPLQE